VFKGLLGLLEDHCSYGDGSESHGAINITRLPEGIVAGLEGILQSGTRSQKIALLDELKMSERNRRLLEVSRSLLLEPDPQLQIAVLEAAAGDVSWTEERQQLLREVWRSSADPGVQTACLYALMESRSPAVNDLFLDCAEEFVRSHGTRSVGRDLNNILHSTIQSNLTRENEGRYAELLTLVLRSSPEAYSVEEYVYTILHLSPKRAVPLLEEALALALASPAALKERIGRALRRVREGEIRASELREAFGEDGAP
jgi:hypothetical protein